FSGEGRSRPGPAGTPASDGDTTRAGLGVGLVVVNAPRPWVPAASSRCDGSYESCQTDTAGRPVPSDTQLAPPFVVTKVPTSVPAYRVLGELGSRMSELTGASGRLALMSFHDFPPLPVAKT